LNTIIIDIVVACVLVLAGAGVVYHHEHPKIVAAEARAEAAEKAAKINEAVTTQVSVKKADLARSSASAVASLHAATVVHHDWASEVVPQEVQDALSR
jgi:hypothetical protein